MTSDTLLRRAAGRAARPVAAAFSRRVPLLGGTTTLADCLVAARYLANPGKLVKGPVLETYERAFARQIGVAHAFGFASGRVGLYGVLQALGVRAGDEVLLQVPTHVVVANAIRYLGARPVFVDCRLDSYNMDLEHAERLVTPRTKALVLQHTFGIPADLDAAIDLARRRDLELVEDCVHALGARYAGRPLGSFGRAAFFSTEETKTITTTMGGMVVTDDPELAQRMHRFQASCAWPSSALIARYVLKFLLFHVLSQPRLYRFAYTLYRASGGRQPAPAATSPEEARGLRPRQYEQRLGNAQAALALRQLARLDENIAHRNHVADEYARLLEPRFAPPRPPHGSSPGFLRFPIQVEDRSRALREAAPCAVLGTWFTSVLEEAACPSDIGYQPGSCPRAEAAATRLINLPTHGRVGSDDIAHIVDAVAGVLPSDR